MSASSPLFGDLLLKLGIVSPSQVQEALALQALTGQRVGEALISLGYVTREQIQDALGEALGLHNPPPQGLTPVQPPLGELLVGVGMFAGAALWLSGRLTASRWARPLHLAVIAALLGGILMSLNYALMGGDTLPWINPANPFNEGISIDSLLALIGIGLVAAHAVAARRTAAAAVHPRTSFDDMAA